MALTAVSGSHGNDLKFEWSCSRECMSISSDPSKAKAMKIFGQTSM